MPIRLPHPAAVFALLAAFALGLAAGPGSARAYQCEQQLGKVLQDRGINQGDVKSVDVVQRSGGAKSAGIYTLDAWVKLNSCGSGHLMVNMTKYCMVQDVYTTGGCSIADVPGY